MGKILIARQAFVHRTFVSKKSNMERPKKQLISKRDRLLFYEKPEILDLPGHIDGVDFSYIGTS